MVVLGTILIVVLMANIVLNMIVSQARLTHHKVSRIQANYAGWAAINYANEMLRIGPAAGGWNAASCPRPNGCNLPNDPNFPVAIQQPIRIFLAQSGTFDCPIPPNPAGVICVSIEIQYLTPSGN